MTCCPWGPSTPLRPRTNPVRMTPAMTAKPSNTASMGYSWSSLPAMRLSVESVSGCRRSRADSLRLCAVGDDIGGDRADRTDCEDCRPGADLLRQGMGSPEPAEVSETQPGGGRPALLRIPGPGGVGTRRGEDDSAERADPGPGMRRR